MTPRAATPLRRWLTAAWLLSVGYPCASLVAQVPPLSIQNFRSPGGQAPIASPAIGFRRSPPLKPAPKPTGDPRLAKLDPSTRMLVEIELRDARPDEREHWLTLIGNVNPDQVPYLLNARRRAAASTMPPPGNNPPATARIQRTASALSSTPVSQGAGYATFAPAVDQSATHAPAMPLAPSQIDPSGPPANVTGTAVDIPAPTVEPAPETAPHPRRWMAPLRGRWGEGRQENSLEVTAAPSSTTAAAPAVAAIDPRSSAYMNVELQRVMTLLRTELDDAEKSGLSPGDPAFRRMHLQIRLLHLLADEPEQALQAIPHLPPDQQEFWIQFLWALTNEIDAKNDQPEEDRLRRTGELLAAAQRQMQLAAPLTVSQACFCHRINSFGSYEKFAQNEFRAGQPLLLYAEVQNFQSELTLDNLYRTRMRSTVEIVAADPGGETVPTAFPADRQNFPATEDLCRSIRHDYFHSYRIDLPAQLPPGSYVLRLTLTDEISRKSTTSTLPFVVR